MPVQISFARNMEDLTDLSPVLNEYLEWDTAKLREVSGITLDASDYVENTFNEIEAYFPPEGRLLMARDSGSLVGIGFLKPIRDGTCYKGYWSWKTDPCHTDRRSKVYRLHPGYTR